MRRLRYCKSALLFLGLIVVSVTFCFVSKLRNIKATSKFKYSCLPKRNIVFLKTHKCASSTVQNMILRYASRHNLTIMLPVFSKSPYLSRLELFSRKALAISHAPWKILGYNVICHHVRFNKVEMEKVMPPDTIYFSIIREPASLFESLYEYNNLAQFYNLTFKEYIKSIRKQQKGLYERAGGNLGPNQMLYDFGMDPRDMLSKEKVSHYVNKLSKQFDYIMIAEHFDESLIILKNLLCWDFNDVLTLNKNVRLNEFKHEMSQEEITLLQKHNWGDQILYKTFLQKHNALVNRIGAKKIEKEVYKLQKMRKKLLKECIRESTVAKNISKVWSGKILGFRTNPKNKDRTCRDVVKSERELTNELRQKQFASSFRYGSSSKNNTVVKEFKEAMTKWLHIQRLKDKDKIIL
ncbi:galactose-3-O-sulfotransferase 3-like [Centruroides sculpturatus]|uniref:galactose-3-O-sulfotransferase 3-like n=1 Tax=Centruroides sculpturatus TaxID=218467 RepID=UPI000C6D0F0C|nr:galactose-3-O-sulfotransferase 3-like [Centruroides sculpturatus]